MSDVDASGLHASGLDARVLDARVLHASGAVTSALNCSGKDARDVSADWAPVRAILDRAVAEGVVPGVAFILCGSGEDGAGVLHEHCRGARNVDTDAAMTADTIFFAASMTKLITAVAVLQLIERGAFALDTPVGEVLSAFDRLPVLDGFRSGVPVLRPAAGRATIRHLLTHTSGLGYDTWNGDLLGFHAITGWPNISSGSREALESIPLTFDPGARFQYGTNYDWLGLAIEQHTGAPLDAYFHANILEPLGLLDTGVRLDGERSARLAPIHRQDGSGRWRIEPATVAVEPEFWGGGQCLYTTPRDFLRLQLALLHGGQWEGVRILSERMTQTLLTNQVSDHVIEPMRTVNPQLSADVVLPAGTGWGFGMFISPPGQRGGRHAGSGGWSGVCNTTFWIDPAAEVVAGIYTQTLPFYAPPTIALFDEVERAAYAALSRAG